MQERRKEGSRCRTGGLGRRRRRERRGVSEEGEVLDWVLGVEAVVDRVGRTLGMTAQEELLDLLEEFTGCTRFGLGIVWVLDTVSWASSV